MDELKQKLLTDFNDVATVALVDPPEGSVRELPRDLIQKKVNKFMRDLAAFINTVKETEVTLADDKLKNEYGEDWLTYRDDRLKELHEERESIRSSFTWNKAQVMSPMDRLRGLGLDARSELRIPVPREGRQSLDGQTDQGKEVDSVS